MGEDLAGANVNRSYALASTNIAIFSFMLFFLYPRFEKGTIDPLLFQATLVAMGLATFSLVFATLHYYRCSLGGRISEAERELHARRGDRLWLVGCTVMFLAPSLVLFLVGLRAVASVWLILWLAYVLFVIRYFPKVETPRG
ncbi:MAG TPA: hypothetical protein VEC56_08260 [Candidatus Krumholzibacteria bacterium]|nr:hypothetical protein [Candidatus Krumholzibacteria bacterium]